MVLTLLSKVGGAPFALKGADRALYVDAAHPPVGPVLLEIVRPMPTFQAHTQPTPAPQYSTGVGLTTFPSEEIQSKPSTEVWSDQCDSEKTNGEFVSGAIRTVTTAGIAVVIAYLSSAFWFANSNHL